MTKKNTVEELNRLSDMCKAQRKFDAYEYESNGVYRGLRDLTGRGVVAGLTNISDVISKKEIDGAIRPCAGELYYRGIDVKEIINGLAKDNRKYGFEEVIYLLLFNKLPNKQELQDFNDLLVEFRKLPRNFVRDVILKAPSADIMNNISRSVLTMYSYDKDALDTSVENVLRQSLRLISVFPQITIYGYQAHKHYNENKSLVIHNPKPNYSIAENILYMLRDDGEFSELEAQVLDSALILHAEHGGGNNSTFTTRVVTSSGTDTYSAVTAGLCSLKGPRHGGANIKVMQMVEDIKHNVKKWNNKDEIRDYLSKMLDGEVFDKKGLIYGMGHAVYTVSDPRAEVFKGFVERLAREKDREKEFALYQSIEEISSQLINEKRKIYKGVSANVDMYSGFAYNMLGLPTELYTPVFAVARVVGWSAHRIEEINNSSKIIRPAYVSTCDRKPYIKMSDR